MITGNMALIQVREQEPEAGLSTLLVQNLKGLDQPQLGPEWTGPGMPLSWLLPEQL